MGRLVLCLFGETPVQALLGDKNKKEKWNYFPHKLKLSYA